LLKGGKVAVQGGAGQHGREKNNPSSRKAKDHPLRGDEMAEKMDSGRDGWGCRFQSENVKRGKGRGSTSGGGKNQGE